MSPDGQRNGRAPGLLEFVWPNPISGGRVTRVPGSSPCQPRNNSCNSSLRKGSRRFVFWARLALRLPILSGLWAAGCATVNLPPVNLKDPGWTVRQGQAVWRRQAGGEGIAGELIVATRADGRAFVEFSKSPFPLVIGQITPKAWSVDYPPQNEQYTAHGTPPERIIFLQLPRALAGGPLPRNWSWQTIADGGWRLENHSTGESIDVYFNP